jgi:hypothetical protein
MWGAARVVRAEPASNGLSLQNDAPTLAELEATSSPSEPGLTLAAPLPAISPQYLATTGSARRPFMRLLDHYGLAQPLDDMGIDIYGFIQGSYTYSFSDPHRDDPTGPDPARHRIQGRMFDHHANRLALNRFDVFVQRAVDYRANKWDVGFLVESQYGTDAAMMHSNGLFDYDYGPYRNHAEPEYQFDLTEAFIDLVMPFGNGIRIRAGKFATLVGYESCDPTTRTSIQFYSRTFILTMGIPMYQTGVIGTYDITDRLTVNAGFTRGWDQSFEDVNSSIDFLGSVNYVVSDELTVYGALSVGPQQPNNDDDWRTLLNGTIYYTPDRNGPWVFALDSIVAWEANDVGGGGDHFPFGKTKAPPGAGYAQDFDEQPVGDTYWFGIAGFAAYKINSQLVAKARAEWFYDADGTRWRIAPNDPHPAPGQTSTYLAGPMNDPFVAVGHSVSAAEFTVGLDWIPFPNDAKELLIRPEVRLDIADKDVFVNGDRSYQVTAAVDVIYKF